MRKSMRRIPQIQIIKSYGYDNNIFAIHIQCNGIHATYCTYRINGFLKAAGVDPQKYVEQGYDSCVALVALFFYCVSHQLNQVVNNLNNIIETL